MPFVKIDLFEGRTEEQKIELAREVTEVVSRVAKAPKEAIHVFINDMRRNDKEKLSQKARRFVLAFFFGCYCFLIGNLMTVFLLSGATLLASDR